MCPWLSSLLHDQPCTGRTTISSSRLPSHTSHGVREKLTKLEPERDGELGLPSARWRVASSQCKQPQRNTKRRRTHRSRKLPTAANFRNTPESSGGAASRIAGGRVWRLSVADDDDEDDDAQKARAAMEKRLAEERRSQRERPTSLDGAGALGTAKPAASSSTVSIPPRITGKEGVTALDIDGSAHDHKFSKVWKDWDASKKDDPGEIARQFMKVSAIKRRGYCAQPRRGGSRSRSRSRRR
mmetsp:Transcript_10836/g.30852  ORF Transcript_10836/g.30852 Transcript_10836/m.30852 type:complete len:241 (-) Transcript_10836:126-848(-)